MYIVIAGNIGSGKTTLTEMLAHHYHWEPKYEQVTYNPYLEDYYKDIQRWSFPMEVFFLKERFRDLMEMQKSGKDTIQDRSIYEGVYVFATNNKRMGNLSDRDFDTFMELFGHMTDIARYPDLMIYLRASVPYLVHNIQKRGRECEQTIQLEYLKGLNDRYEEWIKSYPGKLLIVDGDTLKFESNVADFQRITEQIDAKLYGLFPEE
ncbi:MAG: deoxynucleoside kinase [Bacteroidaceae bacterium]|nr:deoxynucleoside kinase [Bacteroidaceae bacterium]